MSLGSVKYRTVVGVFRFILISHSRTAAAPGASQGPLVFQSQGNWTCPTDADITHLSQPFQLGGWHKRVAMSVLTYNMDDTKCKSEGTDLSALDGNVGPNHIPLLDQLALRFVAGAR